jgi:Secretion system C-terminal sorting domain
MYKLFLSCLIFLGAMEVSAQNPTYRVVLQNDVKVSSTVYEFDIQIMRTGSTVLELSESPGVVCTFNTAISTGTLTYTYVPSSSELVASEIPSAKFSLSGSELRMLSTAPAGAGNGTIVPITPGVRVARCRITSSTPFTAASANIAFKIASGFYTKVFAYVAKTNTDVTDLTGASNFNLLAAVALPVELTSFNANAKGHNVSLTWKTATETNNAGFEVQRKTAAADWSKVAFVDGAGSSATEHNYSYNDAVTSAEKYSYRLKQIDRDGKFEYSSEVEVLTALAAQDYTLGANYPNPFNPSTKFTFAVKNNEQVAVKVFNTIGQEVATLFNGVAAANKIYEMNFNAAGFASGTYFYMLKTSDRYEIKKMVLLK